MRNKYRVCEDKVLIYMQSKTFGEYVTAVSLNKLDFLNEHDNTWYSKYNKHTKSFYVFGKIKDSVGNKKEVLLHRLITSAPQNLQVDHIDHDTLNNTDENLRLLTIAENGQNRKGATSRSKSGVRGVYWHKASKKWCAQIRVNGTKIVVGHYHDLDQAAIAINEAKKQYTPMSFDIF